jgi:hypothetical protein
MLSVAAGQKQNAPVFTEAQCRPSIPSPYVKGAPIHHRCQTTRSRDALPLAAHHWPIEPTAFAPWALTFATRVWRPGT